MLPDNPRVGITDELVQNAVISEIKHATRAEQLSLEKNLLNALESKRLGPRAIEKIALEPDLQSSLMVNLRVYLLEQRNDYANSFRLNMQHPELKKQIFSWIDRSLTRLSQESALYRTFEDLKREVQQRVLALIQQDGGACA